MKIEYDTEAMRAISKDIRTEVIRYKEIMKQFYELVNSFSSTSTWIGAASNNYTRYLNSKSKDYGELYNKMISFCDSLNGNIEEIESAIGKSKVSADD